MQCIIKSLRKTYFTLCTLASPLNIFKRSRKTARNSFDVQIIFSWAQGIWYPLYAPVAKPNKGTFSWDHREQWQSFPKRNISVKKRGEMQRSLPTPCPLCTSIYEREKNALSNWMLPVKWHIQNFSPHSLTTWFFCQKETLWASDGQERICHLSPLLSLLNVNVIHQKRLERSLHTRENLILLWYSDQLYTCQSAMTMTFVLPHYCLL